MEINLPFQGEWPPGKGLVSSRAANTLHLYNLALLIRSFLCAENCRNEFNLWAHF
jgi:hypothetical protein